MSERWRTPDALFDPLMDEFSFELDAAADYETTRCVRYLSDSLNVDDWPASKIWLNPPYGRKLEPFVRKAWEQARRGKTIVALIPFRCRGAWWHECVIGNAIEVRCVRKRPRFVRADGSIRRYTGSCDSCVVVWAGRGNGTTRLGSQSFA